MEGGGVMPPSQRTLEKGVTNIYTDGSQMEVTNQGEMERASMFMYFVHLQTWSWGYHLLQTIFHGLSAGFVLVFLFSVDDVDNNFVQAFGWGLGGFVVMFFFHGLGVLKNTLEMIMTGRERNWYEHWNSQEVIRNGINEVRRENGSGPAYEMYPINAVYGNDRLVDDPYERSKDDAKDYHSPYTFEAATYPFYRYFYGPLLYVELAIVTTALLVSENKYPWFLAGYVPLQQRGVGVDPIKDIYTQGFVGWRVLLLLLAILGGLHVVARDLWSIFRRLPIHIVSFLYTETIPEVRTHSYLFALEPTELGIAGVTPTNLPTITPKNLINVTATTSDRDSAVNVRSVHQDLVEHVEVPGFLESVVYMYHVHLGGFSEVVHSLLALLELSAVIIASVAIFRDMTGDEGAIVRTLGLAPWVAYLALALHFCYTFFNGVCTFVISAEVHEYNTFYREWLHEHNDHTRPLGADEVKPYFVNPIYILNNTNLWFPIYRIACKVEWILALALFVAMDVNYPPFAVMTENDHGLDRYQRTTAVAWKTVVLIIFCLHTIHAVALDFASVFRSVPVRSIHNRHEDSLFFRVDSNKLGFAGIPNINLREEYRRPKAGDADVKSGPGMGWGALSPSDPLPRPNAGARAVVHRGPRSRSRRRHPRRP